MVEKPLSNCQVPPALAAREALDAMDPQPRDASGRRTETLTAPTQRRELRLITYLAPGLPLGLFEVVGQYLRGSDGAERLGERPGRLLLGTKSPAGCVNSRCYGNLQQPERAMG